MSGYILLECIHFFSSHFSLQVEISICDFFHSSLMDSFFFSLPFISVSWLENLSCLFTKYNILAFVQMLTNGRFSWASHLLFMILSISLDLI